ncbi:DUF4840 domain-containing protein [Prevotella sp.]|uniref:DUF4840 domain-containing protein n=1 Tax=Prevotella sp. TaxID=59823 RepID=UPI002F945C66
MKKQNLLLMLMGCVFAVTSLCSCLGDGNDDEQSKVLYLTHAQRMQILNATTGNYTGWMYYADATSHKRDSVAVTWTISGSDSTLTVESLPMKQFAQYLYDKTAKETVEKMNNQRLIAGIYTPYYITKADWDNQFYQFQVVPKDYKIVFNHEGKACELIFSPTALQPYGTYYYPIMQFFKGQNIIYLLVKELKIDQSTYPINNIFILRTKV